jgi:D-tyrosyl-tRNA(Tyr) deacylase
MRAVVQRVKSARVTIEERVHGGIEAGLLVYLGVGKGDTPAQCEWLLGKILGLRIFPNDLGKMDRSLLDVGGALLVVSQFTLYGDLKKGLRPSFEGAMEPSLARTLYEDFVTRARARVPVETGIFAADMQVSSVNDGPVTIWIDSEKSGGIGP